ncbi:MAG: SUMF1/EgtB/PvdO family nonheme iron enzyme [Gammaproteobacteria bacterium]|nr:SUMF1/EgtB/PvdO family nonheme iron enzyme [Gammaproteobacteria bacterium]
MTVKQPLPVLAWLIFLSCISSLAWAQLDYDDGDVFSDSLRSGGNGPTMVVIPAGSMSLGGGSGDSQGIGRVTFSRELAVSATEITAGQYRQFLTATHSAELRKFTIRDDSLPVYGVSWDEAEAYVTWLSWESGHYYRLPSATEWEYAARAGTSTTYSWGNDLGENRANCIDCKTSFAGRHAPVKSFPPNAWKLYDMHGNVWEWTKDCVDPNSAPPPNGLPQLFGNCESRELRGGSAESDGWSIRAGARAFGTRKLRTSDVGIRVVMDVPE